MDGWLIEVTLPGMEHSTRLMKECYAVSIEDVSAATFAVLHKSGGEKPEVVRQLDDDELDRAGIIEAGQVEVVSADF
jgi:hypothetical protein